MKKIKFLLLGFLLSTVLVGCLQVDTRVNINKDGSGTINETVLLKDAVIDMIKGFAVMFDSSKAETFDMFNENELKEKASNFGEGVTYVSGERYAIEEGYSGYKVVYAFEDINKLKLNTNPDDKIPFGKEMEGEMENVEREEQADDILKFHFTKGNPATLEVDFPEPKADEEVDTEEMDVENDSTFNEQSLEKMTQMFDGLKMNLVLDFNEGIDETDASFAKGNEVTLMQIDFSEILKHKDVLKKLEKEKPETMEQFREIVGDIKGIKLEFKDKIKIKF